MRSEPSTREEIPLSAGQTRGTCFPYSEIRGCGFVERWPVVPCSQLPLTVRSSSRKPATIPLQAEGQTAVPSQGIVSALILLGEERFNGTLRLYRGLLLIRAEGPSPSQ